MFCRLARCSQFMWSGASVLTCWSPLKTDWTGLPCFLTAREPWQALVDLCTCPISSQLMQKPEIAPDGRSYQQAAIHTWLHQNATCPFTRLPLSAGLLRPNRALAQLARLVTEWFPGVGLRALWPSKESEGVCQALWSACRIGLLPLPPAFCVCAEVSEPVGAPCEAPYA